MSRHVQFAEGTKKLKDDRKPLKSCLKDPSAKHEKREPEHRSSAHRQADGTRQAAPPPPAAHRRPQPTLPPSMDLSNLHHSHSIVGVLSNSNLNLMGPILGVRYGNPPPQKPKTQPTPGAPNKPTTSLPSKATKHKPHSNALSKAMKPEPPSNALTKREAKAAKLGPPAEETRKATKQWVNPDGSSYIETMKETRKYHRQ